MSTVIEPIMYNNKKKKFDSKCRNLNISRSSQIIQAECGSTCVFDSIQNGPPATIATMPSLLKD